ncbi:MAG: PAS domain S-box protein [Betaproteobacteria bacterium]|nr:PAS domain S-box protein [Betaproteobacteria bacterium]
MASAKSKDSRLRLLLVFAAEDDAALLLARIREAGHEPQSTRVASAETLRSALLSQAWDAILCEHRLPGLSALAALKLMQSLDFDLPFIVISDSIDDKAAARAMRAGAHDCFARNSLERLAPAIEREVRDARHRADHRAALEMLKESEARFRVLAANLPGMVFQLQVEPDNSLRFVYVSEGCHKLFGLKQHELLATPQRFLAAIDTTDRAIFEQMLKESAIGFATLNWEGRIFSNGQAKWINLRSTPQRLDAGGIQWQGIVTDITRSKEIEVQLRGSREQLSELSFHLESAKEEERERIARDIHDELGSTLVAIKIDLALLGAKLPAEPVGGTLLRDKAHMIEALVDRAMNTVSRVARELRPGILKEFGLPAAIEYQAEDFSQRTGIVCRVKCDEDGIELDEKTSLALFRVLQEALTNVAKHAHASLVVVRLRREKGRIALEIRDNGRGISEADMNKPKSFGLRGIRERASSLNGEFTITSAEQGGSHIILLVPDANQGNTAAPAEEEPQRNLF